MKNCQWKHAVSIVSTAHSTQHQQQQQQQQPHIYYACSTDWQSRSRCRSRVVARPFYFYLCSGERSGDTALIAIAVPRPQLRSWHGLRPWATPTPGLTGSSWCRPSGTSASRMWMRRWVVWSRKKNCAHILTKMNLFTLYRGPPFFNLGAIICKFLPQLHYCQL